MGQTLKKKIIGKGRHLEAQYDTDMGNGSYYLYDVIDSDDAEVVGTYRTKAEVLAALEKKS